MVLTLAPEAATLSDMLALRTSPAGFPMAPSAEEWEALSPAERAAVVATLPGEVTYDEIAMPEGDRHSKAKARALDALRGYFTRQRRRIYLAQELPVYYPNEPRFAPDLLAVLDAEDVDRDKWAVSAEGNKGLDWVLEVHVGGDRKKDAEHNVTRYARLGIPEYFLYDRSRTRLSAYRLASPEARVYTPIVPNHGLYESRVLGLDVQVDDDRLRFYAGTALLLESPELIARVQAMYDSAQRRADEEAQRREEAERLRDEEVRRREEAERLRDEEARRREEEARRREEETRRREEAEREVERLRAELERLKR
jgi:Uma2 family endonuclease